jgi:hypothetical protein
MATNALVMGLSNSVVSDQSKQDLMRKDLENKSNESFASSKAPGSGSRVVGASRAIGRNSPNVLDNTSTSNADDLNMKIASVKNVWESITSMPNVLDISGDDSSALDHDSHKLRSPGRSNSDLNTTVSSVSASITSAGVAGSVPSSVNSSVHSMQHSLQGNAQQHHLLGSSGFIFPSMKPIGSDEQLKKSLYSMNNQSSHVLAHQLAHSQQQQQQQQQQHVSNHNQQHHHHSHSQPQAQPNQSMLVSSSPPNLLNHLGAGPGSMDNRRSFAVNQFSSMTNVPRIASPSGMLYNANTNQPQAPNQGPPPNPSMSNPAAHAAAAAAHASMYQQFANQIKGISQQALPNAMMAQFAAAAAAQQHHSHQYAAASHHAALLQQQRGQPLFQQPTGQMNASNASSASAGQQMPPNAAQSQSSQNAPTPDYRLHQQSMAASHLLKQHFVQAQQLQAAVAAAAAAGCPQPGANQQPPPSVGSASFYGAAPPPTPAAAAAAAQKAYYSAQASNAAGTLQHLQNAHNQQHSHMAPGQQLSGPPSHVPQGPPPPNAQYGNFMPTQFGLLGQAQSQMPTGQFRQSKRPNLLNQNNVSYS